MDFSLPLEEKVYKPNRLRLVTRLDGEERHDLTQKQLWWYLLRLYLQPSPGSWILSPKASHAQHLQSDGTLPTRNNPEPSVLER